MLDFLFNRCVDFLAFPLFPHGGPMAVWGPVLGSSINLRRVYPRLQGSWTGLRLQASPTMVSLSLTLGLWPYRKPFTQFATKTNLNACSVFSVWVLLLRSCGLLLTMSPGGGQQPQEVEAIIQELFVQQQVPQEVSHEPGSFEVHGRSSSGQVFFVVSFLFLFVPLSLSLSGII